MVLSCAQFKTLGEVTQGYKSSALFEFDIHATGLCYITIYNVVYVIDQAGGYVTRAKSDGRVLDSSNASVQRTSR